MAVDGYTKKAQGPQPLQLLVSRLPDVVSSSLLAGAETVDAQHATAVEGLQVDIASLKAANQDLSTQISANAAEVRDRIRGIACCVALMVCPIFPARESMSRLRQQT